MTGFGKSNRILKKVDFDAVMNSAASRSSAHRAKSVEPSSKRTPGNFVPAVKVVCPAFIIFAKPTDTELASTPSSSRLGLVVSRKVGNSPRRNLVKRIARENFRLAVLEAGTGRAADWVILARPEAGQLTRAELTNAVKTCIGRLQRRLQEKVAG